MLRCSCRPRTQQTSKAEAADCYAALLAPSPGTMAALAGGDQARQAPAPPSPAAKHAARAAPRREQRQRQAQSPYIPPHLRKAPGDGAEVSAPERGAASAVAKILPSHPAHGASAGEERGPVKPTRHRPSSQDVEGGERLAEARRDTSAARETPVSAERPRGPTGRKDMRNVRRAGLPEASQVNQPVGDGAAFEGAAGKGQQELQEAPESQPQVIFSIHLGERAVDLPFYEGEDF
jgi:hypothetical protein